MRRALLALVLLFATLLAGCASPSAGRPSRMVSPTVEIDDSSAYVVGHVESELGTPVSAMDVVLRPEGWLSVTDEAGEFVFAGVAPGVHVLQFVTSGLVVHEHELRATGGAVVEVEIVLSLPRPAAEPSVTLTMFKGFIHCSTSTVYASNACSAPFGASQDHAAITFLSDRKPREVLLELVWNPNTPATGQELQLSVCAREGSASGLHCADADVQGDFRKSVSGASPLALSVESSEIPSGVEELEAWVGNGELSAYPTIGQSFTLYTTFCYGMLCPEGYTATA